MAFVLLVDTDRVARKAMEGILAQRGHRFAAAESAAEGWDCIQRNVKVDLLLVELKLGEESGLSLIQRLKDDWHLKSLPVVVYTACGDRTSVKAVLDLHVQNFLLKPYRDESVFAEISKALAAPWRQQYFAREGAFCQKAGITPEALRRNQETLLAALESARPQLGQLAQRHEAPAISEALRALATKAKQSAALAILLCLKELNDKALAPDWTAFSAGLERLAFAESILFHHINPARIPPDFLTPEELNQEEEARQRAWWAEAPADDRCPVVSWDQLKQKLDNLSGCPVVDSIAAAYQMAATGRPTSLSPLLDLVQKDPGLTAQILIASNRIKKGKGDSDSSPIEESRTAVGLLGELRLASLGGSLITLEERLLAAPPHFSWPSFRLFQLGTARIARFVCSYLEMPSLEAPAYTAGLLHDIGKLLLARLHPYAFQAILDYAHTQGLKLAAAERHFLGATTLEMGAYFAEKQQLPSRFVNVIRSIDRPEDALQDAELVAIVSLARDLCRHNHVGHCGDTAKDEAVPLGETPEWRVLRSRVFLNFDLKKFERQAHFECQQLKRELLGRLAPSR